jgi:hypothetical protein
MLVRVRRYLAGMYIFFNFSGLFIPLLMVYQLYRSSVAR